MAGEVLRELGAAALDLYVAWEIHGIVRPARSKEDALQRLCLHALEVYERSGGLPVRIVLHRGDEVQVINPETAPVELLERALSLVRAAVSRTWHERGDNIYCLGGWSSLNDGCSRCVVHDGPGYEVRVVVCWHVPTTRLGAGRPCTSGFGVEVHLWE